MPYKVMDPSDDLNWSHDWTDFLASGETISTRLWTISPDSSPTLLSNPTAAAVHVAGLAAGTVYLLSEKIITDASPQNTAERSLSILCEDH